MTSPWHFIPYRICQAMSKTFFVFSLDVMWFMFRRRKNTICLDMLDSPGHGTTGHNKNFLTGSYRGTAKQNYLSKSYSSTLMIKLTQLIPLLAYWFFSGTLENAVVTKGVSSVRYINGRAFLTYTVRHSIQFLLSERVQIVIKTLSNLVYFP